MVELIINTHTFSVSVQMWDYLQPYMSELMRTGRTQFGFIDTQNIYRDVRISNGTVIITVTGEAPEYVHKQFTPTPRA